MTTTNCKSHRSLFFFSFLLAGTITLNFAANAQTELAKSSRTTPPAAALLDSTTSELINIGKISLRVYDNGSVEKNVNFPHGGPTLVNEGGLLWAGMVNDGLTPRLNVGGQARNVGTIPGVIRESRLPENRYSRDVRVYRIRRDWKTADLKQDAAETFGISIYDVTSAEISELRRRYTVDWLTWPWQRGAPYYERNGIPGYQADTSGVMDSTKDEPGLANADQVVWLVCNDLSPAVQSLAGSRYIGMEQQITCWAYKSESQLGNIVFEKHRLIYKGTTNTPSNATIDSMYIAKWADTDIGDFKDDLSGCMIERNLAYSYNSKEFDYEFNRIGMLPPIVAYDYLQGPTVPKPGATAHWNFSTVSGYQNLAMTSFVALVDSEFRDMPLRISYNGTLQWWRLMHGYQPMPSDSPYVWRCYTDPFSGQCTKYPFSGDPTTYRGWVDGKPGTEGDRRMLLSSGPFQMALGDTQEVVFAIMAATGANRVERFQALDSIDNLAQSLYERDFKAMKPVPKTSVKATELDNVIILDWDTDESRKQEIETYNSFGYKFEGYRIYQYRSTSTTDKYVELPAFDPNAPRTLYLTYDYIRKKSLVNGIKYYYAITSVMVNPNAPLSIQRIESDKQIITVTPHSPNPGIVYPYVIGDTITNVKNIVGYNDAPVIIKVDDPSKVSGDSLKIVFRWPDTDRKPLWSLVNVRTRDTLIKNIYVDKPLQAVPSEGISVMVKLQQFGLKGIVQTMYDFKQTNYTVFNVPNPEKNYMIVSRDQSQLDFLNGSSAIDTDIELRFDGDSSWALLRRATVAASKWIRVPYTAWQMKRDDADPVGRKIFTVITQQGQDSIWRPATLLDREYNGQTLKVFYPITAVVDSYCVGPNRCYGRYLEDRSHPDFPFAQGYLFNVTASNEKGLGIYQVYIADLDNDGAPFPRGTVVRFKRYKDIFVGDEKLILPSAILKNDANSARVEIEKINVFPNPYYGINKEEPNKASRFVTFNHLPHTATIKIYNLAGVLVKTVQKSDESQFATWDLSNENNLPVASGLYIAQIDMKENVVDFGTKVLKLMIVQEERFKQ